MNLANKIDFSGEGFDFKLFKDLQGNVYFLYSDKQTEDLKKSIKVFKFNPDKNNIDLWKEFSIEEYKLYSNPVSFQNSFAFTTITPIPNTNKFTHNTYVVDYSTKNLEHKYKHILDNISNSNYQSDEYGIYYAHTMAAAKDRYGDLSFEEYYYTNTFNLPGFVCSSGNPGELKEFAKVYDTNSAKFVVLSIGGNSLVFGNNPDTQRLIYNNLNSDHFRTVIKEDRSCEITLSNTDNLKIGESIKAKERIIQVIYDTETTGRYSIIDEIEKKLTKLGDNKYSNYTIWIGYGFSLSSNSFSFLTDEVVSDFYSNSSERNTVLHTYLIKENNNSYAVQEEKQDDDSFFLFKIFRSIVDIFTRIFS